MFCDGVPGKSKDSRLHGMKVAVGTFTATVTETSFAYHSNRQWEWGLSARSFAFVREDGILANNLIVPFSNVRSLERSIMVQVVHTVPKV